MAELVYQDLSPERILAAVESAGFATDGRLTALNSYENRVLQVGIEGEAPVIVKFYRPGRWTDDEILEEHRFVEELADADLLVARPIDIDGETLIHADSHRMAFYDRIPGRAPALDSAEHLETLGRLMARLHNIGEQKPFQHRPALDINRHGEDPWLFVLDNDFVPPELQDAWESAGDTVLDLVEARINDAGETSELRLHGDAHPGNILWTHEGPWLVDLDDAISGPAIQDLWMFLSGDRSYMTARLTDLIEGYEQFRSFDARELVMIEALRSLRILHFNGWLARRWVDPAFPKAFPQFGTVEWWQDQVQSLREQIAAMQESPLELP